MAGLSVVFNKAGDAFVGFEHEGAFVVVNSVSEANVRSAVERAEGLAKLADSNDPETVQRHDAAAELRPYTSKAKNAKGGES